MCLRMEQPSPPNDDVPTNAAPVVAAATAKRRPFEPPPEFAIPAARYGPGVCSACGVRASGAAELLLCTHCRAVSYCNAACQLAHWQAEEDGHKAQCKALRVRATDHRPGQQGLFCGETPFVNGELIITEVPFAIVNLLDAKDAKDAMEGIPTNFPADALVIAMVRQLLAPGALCDAMVHYFYRSTSPALALEALQAWASTKLAGNTIKMPDHGMSKTGGFQRHFEMLWSIVSTNALCQRSPCSDQIVSMVIPTLGCRMNHSCVPNAEWSYESTHKRFNVRAKGPIAPGQEITISYAGNWTFAGIKDAKPGVRAYTMGKMIWAPEGCDCLEACRGVSPEAPASVGPLVPNTVEGEPADTTKLLAVLRGQHVEGTDISYRFDVMRQLMKSLLTNKNLMALGGTVSKIKEIMDTFEPIADHLTDPWEAMVMKVRIAFCHCIFAMNHGCLDEVVIRATLLSLIQNMTALGLNFVTEDIIYKGALTRFIIKEPTPLPAPGISLASHQSQDAALGVPPPALPPAAVPASTE